MDLSSLTEAQQQQLQQLQQQFQEHQAQQQAQAQAQAQAQQQQQQQYQQQQNQDYASQAYDPSQVQAYDQSTQAYYSYYQQQQQPQQNQPQHHQQHHQQQSEQQYASYYQPDYANAYQQQQQPPHQHESAQVQPPGVQISQPMDGSGGGLGQAQVQHQHNAYYPQGVDQHQHQHQHQQQQQQQQQGSASSSSYPVPPGLNAAAAAAVAALSQLTQFAGTMDAAERAMAGLQERQWHGKGGEYGPMMGRGPFPGPGPMHRGPGPMHQGPGPMRPPVGRSPYRGGGRRGGPFRGGSRGNFGHRHSRSGGSGPPFRGRGRGRGRGGPRRFPPHGASSTSSHPEPSDAEDAESTEEEEEPLAVVTEEAPQAVVPPETSPSGKVASNRRPPQVAWCELCRVDCTSLEILEQHKNGKRHKKTLQRIEELKNANKMGAEIQNEPNPELTSQPENVQEGEENKPTKNLLTEAVTNENKMVTEEQNDQVAEEESDLQGRNPRTDRFDNWRRGMKRKMRGGRGGKRMKTFEAPRRPVEPPKPKVVIPLICDLCNVKCDTQEVFDRHLAGKKHISKLKRFEGHQAMYGPMVQALYPPNPIAQTLFLPQSHQQQAFYGPQVSYPPPGPYMPPQVHQAAPGSDAHFQQNFMPQGSEATAEYGGQKSAMVVPEAQHALTGVNPVNGISESEGKGFNPPPDNTITGAEQVIHASNEAASFPDYGVAADNVILPGLDMQAKGGLAE